MPHHYQTNVCNRRIISSMIKVLGALLYVMHDTFNPAPSSGVPGCCLQEKFPTTQAVQRECPHGPGDHVMSVIRNPQCWLQPMREACREGNTEKSFTDSWEGKEAEGLNPPPATGSNYSVHSTHRTVHYGHVRRP